MRDLADSGYVPAIRVVPSLADFANLDPALIATDHAFKAIWTNVLLASGE